GFMHWLALAFVHSPQIAFPEGSAPTLQLILRWLHFAAGITWVGLLYFFVLVNSKFLPELDPPTRMKVVPSLMSRALWWFRWSSVVTVLVGFEYWRTIVGADAHNANAGSGHVIGTFFVLWTAAFAVEMGLLMSPAEVLRKGPVFGTIVGVVILAT